MKNENPIQEIWAIREKLSADEGFDVHRMFERLRREQAKYADRLVHAAPRRATDGEPSAIVREEPPAEG